MNEAELLEIKKLRGQLADALREIDGQRVEISVHEDNGQILCERLASAMFVAEEWQKKAAEWSRKNAALRGQLRREEEENDSFADSLRAQAAEIEALRGQLTEATQRADFQECEAMNLEKRLAEAERQRDELVAKVGRVDRSLHSRVAHD